MTKQQLINELKKEGTLFKLFNSDNYIVKSLGVRKVKHNNGSEAYYLYHQHTETNLIGWLAVDTLEFALTNYNIKLVKKK